MKLGISTASYSQIFIDQESPDFDYSGLPKCYFSSLFYVKEDRMIWFIKKAKTLGLSTVNGGISNLEDVKRLNEIKRLLEETSLEFIPAFDADYVAVEDSRDEFRKEIKKVFDMAKFLGAKLIWTCCKSKKCHRFRKNLPLAQQIDKMSENFAIAAEIARSYNIPLAWENHLDYRASDMVEVIKKVNSDYLKVSFDTANPFTVCEEPVEAAKLLAPYVATVHLKDFRVIPWTVDGPRILGCPLGEGSVDLEKILEILQRNVQNPMDLSLNIEISFPPSNVNIDRWIIESIKFCRDRFSKYLK